MMDSKRVEGNQSEYGTNYFNDHRLAIVAL